MKKLVILLSLMVFACSSDDNDKENQTNTPHEDTLIGTWKLIEHKIFSISSGEMVWITITEPFNFTYEFGEDNSLIRSNYVCDGTYENNPTDYLVTTFDCPEFPLPDVREYHLSFENHNLVLIEPGSCDESGACGYKFSKVISN
ncbi:hypothetical protein LRR18_05930 [Mangrovimonas sp. AS39]|uniref:hypothetical protein n=1 Tax=Mangrovimonas futianensis TaxID=2895523 RepID=UPI001E5FF803|nr:hypothetical protein [Mangrovimonas futianensis]MCF1191118.1 hypothetical protein [Mangrovimonas futianensis]MCF1194813.1 hypothetical protein [Mangrovimonas futianensis]